MPVRFEYRRIGVDEASEECIVDDQDLIRIGRDHSAELTLLDEDRMVSRMHAQLERRGDGYYLCDLGSRNLTFLGEESLETGTHHRLNDGDLFRVANFEVRFHILEAEPEDLGQTIIDPAFINPFRDPVTAISRALRDMQHAYERLQSARRDVALSEALDSLSHDVESGRIPRYVAGALSGEGRESMPLPAQDGDAVAFEATPDAADMARPTPSESGGLSSPIAGAHRQTSPTLGASAGEIEGVLRVLLQAAAELVDVPHHFKYEFAGQTKIHSPDARGIYESDGAGLHDYLFSDGDEQSVEMRLQLLEQALEDTVVHCVAMIDGYKAAVEAGAKELFQYLDAGRLEDDVAGQNGLHRLLPFLLHAKAWRLLRARHASLKGESITAWEERAFRPAFIKAYLTRMSAGRKS